MRGPNDKCTVPPFKGVKYQYLPKSAVKEIIQRENSEFLYQEDYEFLTSWWNQSEVEQWKAEKAANNLHSVFSNITFLSDLITTDFATYEPIVFPHPDQDPITDSIPVINQSVAQPRPSEAIETPKDIYLDI